MNTEKHLMSFLAVYLVSAGIWTTTSRCATHWKLVKGEIKAVESSELPSDPIFEAIVNSYDERKGRKYEKRRKDNVSLSCQRHQQKMEMESYQQRR